jgi:AraC-like DNA-binding protein
MTPDPMAIGRTMLHTADIDDAQQALSKCYLPLRLRLAKRRPAIDTRLDTVDLGRATVGAIRFGADMQIRTESATNFHVDLPVAGRCVSQTGATDQVVTQPGTAQVFMPGVGADLQWTADTRQLCVMLDRFAVESRLAALLGCDLSRPLVFATIMDLRSSGGITWARVLRLIDHEMCHATGLLSHALTRRTLEGLLIEGLLTGQHHNYSDELNAPRGRSGSPAIRRAVDLIQARPERAWTNGALAIEAGIALRAFQTGFRAVTGASPMAYVRAVRLERAHEELRLGAPEATVSQIARRWGFVHLGRFAAAYDQRYGQLPSVTLGERRG